MVTGRLQYDPSNADAHSCGYVGCRGGQIAPPEDGGGHYDCPGPPGVVGTTGPSTVGYDTAQEIAEFAGRRAGMSGAASVLAEAVLADAVRRDPPRPALPADSSVRKRTPLCTGCLDYFDGALALLAAADPLDPDEEWDHETCLLEALRCRGDNGTLEYVAIMQHSLAILHRELSGDPPPQYRAGFGGLFEAYAAELSEVAQVSWHGNEKHNPGLPLHHARGKSTDHADCIARHVIDNAVDPGGYDGPMRHAACLVWRSFALTQEACEARGAPKARGAK